MAIPVPHECPRCGAPLPKNSGGRIVCKYCRVTVNVPTRQPPVNRHPARQGTELPAWAKPWLRVEALVSVMLVLGMVAWQLYEHSDLVVPQPTLVAEPPAGDEVPNDSPPDPQPEPPVTPEVRRVAGKPLLAGAGDGERVVALAEFSDGRAPWLAAWRASDGELLWRWALAEGGDAVASERAVLDDSILVRTGEKLVRLDANTGQVVWTARVPTSNGRLCATKAYVAIHTDKPPEQALERETGAPLVVKPGACETLYSSLDDAPNFRYLPATAPELPKRPKDFTVHRGLLPKSGNARVVIGTKGPDAVPAVAVVANGRWVWQQEVSEFSVARLPEPALAAVRRESVVVPFWDERNRTLRLAAFNLTNGARTWERVVAEGVASGVGLPLEVAVALDGLVFVSFDDRLQAHSLLTGELQWSVGGR